MLDYYLTFINIHNNNNNNNEQTTTVN